MVLAQGSDDKLKWLETLLLSRSPWACLFQGPIHSGLTSSFIFVDLSVITAIFPLGTIFQEGEEVTYPALWAIRAEIGLGGSEPDGWKFYWHLMKTFDTKTNAWICRQPNFQ